MGRTSKHKAQAPTKAASSAAKVSDFTAAKKPVTKQTLAALAEEHLPPLSLVCCVFIFSGSLFVLGLRDALATGKIFAGPHDEALQVSYPWPWLTSVAF